MRSFSKGEALQPHPRGAPPGVPAPSRATASLPGPKFTGRRVQGAGRWDGSVCTSSGAADWRLGYSCRLRPTPILVRPDSSVLEGEGEGGGEGSREDLTVATGGRFPEDSAAPPFPSPVDCPVDGTARLGALCSRPRGDSNLVPRAPRFEKRSGVPVWPLWKLTLAGIGVAEAGSGGVGRSSSRRLGAAS